MKRTLIKMLICLLIILTLFNLTFNSNAYATSVEGLIGSEPANEGDDAMNTIYNLLINVLGAFVGIGTWIIRILIFAITAAIQVLMSGIASIGGVAESGFMVTPFTIFFNEVPLLDIDFMDFNAPTTTINDFRTSVATWYYVMRMIATAILLLILIYIGIRMALSTMAQDKVIYKKMLVDWATSLALLYLLHYFIIFIIDLNSSFIEILKGIGNSDDSFNITEFIKALMLSSLSPLSGFTGIASTLIYIMMIFQTLKFLFIYLKRMITIGFLIIISPLITITYSIDKIGDQRAQALNTWMKEFCYNILIQPFHCIMYLAFAGVIFKLIGGADILENVLSGVLSFIPSSEAGGNNSLATGILAIMCLKFVDDGEKIIRKIFGFEKASSLESTVAATAAVTGLVSNAGKLGQGFANSKIGKNMFKGVRSTVKKQGDRLGKLVGGVGSKIDKMSTENKAKKLAATNAPGESWSKMSEEKKESYRKEARDSKLTAKKGTAKSFSERRKEKREERIDAEAMKIAKARGHNWDSMTPENKEALRNEAKQNIATNSMSNKISNLGKRTISGVKSVVNKDNIAIASGVIAAGAMYGAGSGGALSAILSGAAAAKFTSEAFSNSKGQVKKDISQTMQETTAVTGYAFENEEQKRNHLENVKFLGDMGQLSQDKVGKELENLVSKLQEIIQGLSKQEATVAAGRIQQQLKFDPNNFNLENALSQALGSKYNNLSKNNQGEVTESARQFLTTAQNAKLYEGIQTAEKMNLDTSDLAKAVATTVATSAMASAAFGSQEGSGSRHVETHTETENVTTYETEDIDSKLEDTRNQLETLSRSLAQMSREQIDSTISEINKTMERLEATNNKTAFNTTQLTQYNNIKQKLSELDETVKNINNRQ